VSIPLRRFFEGGAAGDFYGQLTVGLKGAKIHSDYTAQRAKQVTLTDRGQTLDKAAREILRQVEKDWAEQPGGSQMAELKQALRDLIALISQTS
jgi:hypothetical protein